MLYVLERFLYWLSISQLRDRLVLKGGMLFAAIQRQPASLKFAAILERVRTQHRLKRTLMAFLDAAKLD